MTTTIPAVQGRRTVEEVSRSRLHDSFLPYPRASRYTFINHARLVPNTSANRAAQSMLVTAVPFSNVHKYTGMIFARFAASRCVSFGLVLASLSRSPNRG